MADEALKKSVKINGKRRRSWKLPDGTYTDPFVNFDFYSRTFLPEGTEILEADTDEDMIIEITKDKKVKFKTSNLSDDSKIKFLDNGIDDQVEDDQGDDQQ